MSPSQIKEDKLQAIVANPKAKKCMHVQLQRGKIEMNHKQSDCTENDDEVQTQCCRPPRQNNWTNRNQIVANTKAKQSKAKIVIFSKLQEPHILD